MEDEGGFLWIDVLGIIEEDGYLQMLRQLTYLQRNGHAIFTAAPADAQFFIFAASGKFGGLYPSLGVYSTSSDTWEWDDLFDLEDQYKKWATSNDISRLSADIPATAIIYWEELQCVKVYPDPIRESS